MKSIILAMFFLPGLSGIDFNQINLKPDPATTEHEASRLKLRIIVDHGDWDEEKEKCVDDKGWCKIRVEVIFMTAPGQGGGEIWYDGKNLNWVAIKEQYTTETFNEVLGGSTYTMKKDFRLPDDVCDALGVGRGYIIKGGAYKVTGAGTEYASGDRKVVF